jgi:hypothetical protein
MASDETSLPGSVSFNDEDEMATYYMMERDHDHRQEEQLSNGLRRYNVQKGHPKAGSSQSICKYSCMKAAVLCAAAAVAWRKFTDVSETLAASIMSDDDEGNKHLRNVCKLLPNYTA